MALFFGGAIHLLLCIMAILRPLVKPKMSKEGPKCPSGTVCTAVMQLTHMVETWQRWQQVQGLHLDAFGVGYWRDKKTKHVLASGFQMYLVGGLREQTLNCVEITQFSSRNPKIHCRKSSSVGHPNQQSWGQAVW